MGISVETSRDRGFPLARPAPLLCQLHGPAGFELKAGSRVAGSPYTADVDALLALGQGAPQECDQRGDGALRYLP